ISLRVDKGTFLEASTNYIFSSSTLKSYSEIGGDVKVEVSVYRVAYLKICFDYFMVDVVYSEPSLDGIMFISIHKTYTAIDIKENYSLIVFILDFKGLIDNKDDKILNDLDIFKLMLNKGTVKQAYQPYSPDIIERISKSEPTLDIHAESIELKAEKSELENYV